MVTIATIIGIDYSGAKSAQDPLSGLRVFVAEDAQDPSQIVGPLGRGNMWSRESLNAWLVDFLARAEKPCLVGIDHAFSFPQEYFERYGLARSWDVFLDDFISHWPSHREASTVSALLAQNRLSEDGRTGDAKWRRLTERFSKGAKSVFHFSVPGSVASSTHAGLPWLSLMRTDPRLHGRIHFWPFDGWTPAAHQHVIAEIYPSLWNKKFINRQATQDEHDAWVVCEVFKDAAGNGKLADWLNPERWEKIKLSPDQIASARTEGWILGLN